MQIKSTSRMLLAGTSQSTLKRQGHNGVPNSLATINEPCDYVVDEKHGLTGGLSERDLNDCIH